MEFSEYGLEDLRRHVRRYKTNTKTFVQWIVDAAREMNLLNHIPQLNQKISIEKLQFLATLLIDKVQTPPKVLGALEIAIKERRRVAEIYKDNDPGHSYFINILAKFQVLFESQIVVDIENDSSTNHANSTIFDSKDETLKSHREPTLDSQHRPTLDEDWPGTSQAESTYELVDGLVDDVEQFARHYIALVKSIKPLRDFAEILAKNCLDQVNCDEVGTSYELNRRLCGLALFLQWAVETFHRKCVAIHSTYGTQIGRLQGFLDVQTQADSVTLPPHNEHELVFCHYNQAKYAAIQIRAMAFIRAGEAYNRASPWQALEEPYHENLHGLVEIREIVQWIASDEFVQYSSYRQPLDMLTTAIQDILTNGYVRMDNVFAITLFLDLSSSFRLVSCQLNQRCSDYEDFTFDLLRRPGFQAMCSATKLQEIRKYVLRAVIEMRVCRSRIPACNLMLRAWGLFILKFKVRMLGFNVANASDAFFLVAHLYNFVSILRPHLERWTELEQIVDQHEWTLFGNGRPEKTRCQEILSTHARKFHGIELPTFTQDFARHSSIFQTVTEKLKLRHKEQLSPLDPDADFLAVYPTCKTVISSLNDDIHYDYVSISIQCQKVITDLRKQWAVGRDVFVNNRVTFDLDLSKAFMLETMTDNTANQGVDILGAIFKELLTSNQQVSASLDKSKSS